MDAIFYEVYVRGFYDSNADGFGDFRGLIEKLDYIQWLGVDCVCLTPIYDSPVRDCGLRRLELLRDSAGVRNVR